VVPMDQQVLRAVAIQVGCDDLRHIDQEQVLGQEIEFAVARPAK